MPPVEVLRSLFEIDSESGWLRWKPRRVCMFSVHRGPEKACAAWNSRYAGREAFTASDNDGYRVGTIFGRQYRAHRIVFALHHGRLPIGQIDHIDCDKANNAPTNLREVTNRQNSLNCGGKGGASPYRGVSWDSRDRLWVAKCTDAHGNRLSLGCFRSEIAAAHAYDAMATRLHGAIARPNFPQIEKPLR